ncbi:VOC family protein [Enterococcus sp. DIV0086]|uniref:VOC family protein n=1 Tax=Enterococcus sp. DIV0086 TaxID=2774655 RepID=UPI003D26DB40
MEIEHIGLWVNDLEMMKDFYTAYFNATATELYHNSRTGFRSYFLIFKDGARLEIQNKSGLVDGNNFSLVFAHLAIKVGEVSDVNRMTTQFIKDGFEILNGPRWTGDGYYESIVKDPEGNLLELTI